MASWRPTPPPQVQGLQYGQLRRLAPLPAIGVAPPAAAAVPTAAPARRRPVAVRPTPSLATVPASPEPVAAAAAAASSANARDTAPSPAVGDAGDGDYESNGSDNDYDSADDNGGILMVDVPRGGAASPSLPTAIPLELLAHVDPAFVGQWRDRTRDARAEHAAWWHQGRNALHFSHFWLAEMPDAKRAELLEMEAGLLVDELRLALHDVASLPAEAPAQLFCAMVHEYPDAFAGDGTDFLDLAHVLAAGAQGAQGLSYMRVIGDLGPQLDGTIDPPTAALVEDVRAFALTLLVTAVTKFYQTLCTLEQKVGGTRPGTSAEARPGTAATQVTARPWTSARPTTAAATAVATAAATSARPVGTANSGGGIVLPPAADEAFAAAKLGYTAVLYYALSRGRVACDAMDALGRTLLGVAAVHSRLETAAFLLQNPTLFDLNHGSAASGNSILHTVVALGDARMAELLLQHGARADLPSRDSGATARDIAAMMDNAELVELCDRYCPPS